MESNNEIMLISETASLIKRSSGAVRNLVLRKKIPFRKLAGRLIFLRKEIDAWIENADGVHLDEIDDT